MPVLGLDPRMETGFPKRPCSTKMLGKVMSNQTPIEVRIVRLPHGRDLPLPQYQSAFAAGLDLMAAVPADAAVEIPPGGRAAIPTGVAIALPQGSEGQIRPRS